MLSASYFGKIISGDIFKWGSKLSVKIVWLILEVKKAENLNKIHCTGEQGKNDPYYLHGLIWLPNHYH